MKIGLFFSLFVIFASFANANIYGDYMDNLFVSSLNCNVVSPENEYKDLKNVEISIGYGGKHVMTTLTYPASRKPDKISFRLSVENSRNTGKIVKATLDGGSHGRTVTLNVSNVGQVWSGTLEQVHPLYPTEYFGRAKLACELKKIQ